MEHFFLVLLTFLCGIQCNIKSIIPNTKYRGHSVDKSLSITSLLYLGLLVCLTFRSLEINILLVIFYALLCTASIWFVAKINIYLCLYLQHFGFCMP